MKIKILQDIPGFKAGEIINVDPIHGFTEKKDGRNTWYDIYHLIEGGWAEEIK